MRRQKRFARTGHPGPRSLVAGGAGFLASHMCERLLAERHGVICVDNLVTGSLENIRHLMNNEHFCFLQHDVSQSFEIETHLNYILHLASPASPRDFLKYPVETLRVGALGTQHLLDLARSKGAVFLLASSSEVYGDPEVNPQVEEYWGRVNPIGPRSVYDESKRYAEALTMAYRKTYGLQVRIARIFNCFGERMRINDGRVLPNFMMQALQNKPLTIYGDGQQTRSLCYVSDLIEALCRLLFSGETGPINLGNPEEVRVIDLAHEIIRLTRSKNQIVFEPLPQDDPRRRKPDISKAIKNLGWEPKVPRQEGLRRVIPYFKAQVEALCVH